MTLNNSIRRCSVDGCDSPHIAKSYCSKHYQRWSKTGLTDLIAPSMTERFWKKADKSGDCWLWTGSKMSSGYGSFNFYGNVQLAHRVSWILKYGPIPIGYDFHGTCVLHKCDTKLCVNPDHLFLGTNADNVADMLAKGRAWWQKPH